MLPKVMLCCCRQLCEALTRAHLAASSEEGAGLPEGERDRNPGGGGGVKTTSHFGLASFLSVLTFWGLKFGEKKALITTNMKAKQYCLNHKFHLNIHVQGIQMIFSRLFQICMF